MRRRDILTAALCSLMTPPLTTRAARADDSAVDVQLVLAVDSSSSVSIDEYYVQLEGYAAAFRHPDLLAAIKAGPNGAVAVTLIEWSDAAHQVVNFPWRLLATAADLQSFADELALAPRLVAGGETAIGEAIAFALAQFEIVDFVAARRVIDVSGDGASNRGRRPDDARDDALQRGIVINGLAILNEEPELDDFYRRFVIGGVGSFVLTARDYTDFADAILRKLLREVQLVADAR